MKTDTVCLDRRKLVTTSASLVGGALLLKATSSFAEQTAPQKNDTGLCVLSQEEVSGPYFRNTKLIRRDITESEPGLPLLIKIKVVERNSCTPLHNVFVDIWHCNARGSYSGWSHINPDLEAEPDNVGKISRTDDKTFLRGSQQSDSQGILRFTSVYPGFYAGRATHIHLAIRKPSKNQNDTSHFAYVGQLYFPEEYNRNVYQLDSYTHRKIKPLSAADDEIYKKYHGERSVLNISTIGGDGILNGLLAEIEIAIDLSNSSEFLKKDDLYEYTV